MSIHATCDSCGKTVKAKDSLAGRRVKCPKCGETIQIPEAVADEFDDVYDADETPFGDIGDPDDWGETTDDLSTQGRKPCPMCGEMIKKQALKCRFCGESLDSKPKKRKKKRKAATYDDADMTTGDWVVAILCSGIGCIAGIVWMIQGKPKGVKMFGISLGMQLFWGVVRVIIELAAQR